jgi:hypothetical protein
MNQNPAGWLKRVSRKVKFFGLAISGTAPGPVVTLIGKSSPSKQPEPPRCKNRRPKSSSTYNGFP